MTKTYEVTVSPKRPAYGDRGTVIEIAAETKAKAISEARRHVARHCVYDRLDGPLIYKAEARA